MDDFLRFVVERHRIWEKRQAGEPAPWTDDPVLATKKFTNVFRVLDPGTQFVLKELLDPSLEPRDQLLRLFLYRHTGRVEAWEWLDLACGYPTAENLEEVREAWKDYRGTSYRRLQGKKSKTTGGFQTQVFERKTFTGAYLVFPQSSEIGTDKLDSILDLALGAFTPGSPKDVMPAWEAATSNKERFLALRSVKGVGDFMSMQVLADWVYSQPVDTEEDFLQPGPGSIKGAKALRPDVPPREVVDEVVQAVRGLPDCPRLGYYRKPSLMDIGSNLLCEWSKYVRFREQPKGAPYRPAHPGPQPAPVLPSYYTEDLL